MTENRNVNVCWMVPSVLNLHGDRGNVMALEHVGKMLGQTIHVERHEQPDTPPDLKDADLMIFGPGQVRDMPAVVRGLQAGRSELDDFLARGGYILAIGTTGCVFANETLRTDGTRFPGLGLLPMTCRERDTVYGDDIWFRTKEKDLEILGCQIQVVDTILDEGAEPFGTIEYGYGNCGKKDEGCRNGNVIFTNTLGPMLIKNPRFTAALLRALADADPDAEPDTGYEDESAELVRAFIRKKMGHDSH